MTLTREAPMPRYFHVDAVAAGQFSRRHETRDAHDEARATYKAEHGREARRRKASERLTVSSSRDTAGEP